VFGRRHATLWGSPVVRETVAGAKFSFGVASFFQINVETLELIAQRFVERVVLVSDAAIRDAQRRLWSALRIVAEPGGAAALAALTSGGPRQTGKVTPVTPRAVGILVEDSHDPLGARSFVEHFVTANTPLPVTRTEERFGTIVQNQESVRIQVYEQAGSAPSAEVEHNRLVLDGELTQIPPLPAGSVIRVTVRIAIDGRLTVLAHEPTSGRELVLEAFVEGVVDDADTQRLTRLVGLTSVRG